ncbi:MAG TPA: glycosyltransferase family 2 protein [Chitinophagaceae bacterium]|nr:glycosyltransferase family 2 protein [Chitinophagaceae bacterium]
MNNIPVVSISIPTYNRASILDNTLQSLFSQVDAFNLSDKVEVVISDNASGDNTSDVINKYIRTDKYRILRHRNEKNLGVIRNMLKLVELCTGKYWMFYGDDDKVPEGALPELVKCLEENNSYPAFMFKQHGYISSSFKEYTTPHTLSISDLAEKYFYYIGNGGVFAVDAALAKKAMSMNDDNLLKTCWPQTEILFIAAHLNEKNKEIYASTVQAVDSYVANLNFNSSYYFFETTLYSLLRSALSINEIVKNNFAEHAYPSVYGVASFKIFNVLVIEHYHYFDYVDEKKEFRKSLAEAMHTIPAAFKKEIIFIHKWIDRPKWILAVWLYLNYFKRILNTKMESNFIRKLLIMSPAGYLYYIKNRRSDKANHYKQKGKKIITSESGYF